MSNVSPPIPEGFNINSKVISATVGIIAIVTALLTAVNKINDYGYRIEKIEYSDSLHNSEVKTLTSELKTLNNELTGLTIEIREMRAENKAIQQLYKK